MAKGRYHGGIDFWHAEKKGIDGMARHVAGGVIRPSRREMAKQYPSRDTHVEPWLPILS